MNDDLLRGEASSLYQEWYKGRPNSAALCNLVVEQWMITRKSYVYSQAYNDWLAVTKRLKCTTSDFEFFNNRWNNFVPSEAGLNKYAKLSDVYWAMAMPKFMDSFPGIHSLDVLNGFEDDAVKECINEIVCNIYDSTDDDCIPSADSMRGKVAIVSPIVEIVMDLFRTKPFNKDTVTVDRLCSNDVVELRNFGFDVVDNKVKLPSVSSASYNDETLNDLAKRIKCSCTASDIASAIYSYTEVFNRKVKEVTGSIAAKLRSVTVDTEFVKVEPEYGYEDAYNSVFELLKEKKGYSIEDNTIRWR